MHQQPGWIGFIVLALSLGILLTLGGLTPAVQAGDGLPDRETPTPTPVPTLAPTPAPTAVPTIAAKREKKPEGPVGAYISLVITDPLPAGWAVVEWVDADGNWHPVEGWRGSLDASGERTWWVSERDFGRGPFRWLVFDAPDGSLLLTSEAFMLPDNPNQVLMVTPITP